MQMPSEKILQQSLQEAYRKHLLDWSRIGAYTAGPIYIFTIIGYNFLYAPHSLKQGILLSVFCALAVWALAFTLQTKFIQKHCELPLFLILAVISNFAEITNYQLTGRTEGFFFFPYFLLAFATVVFYPARLIWVAATLLTTFITFPASEYFWGLSLSSAQFVTHLLYLLDICILALVGNRFLFKIFLRDKKNEILLKQANQQLQELDKSKNNFFANVSHELKTPMTLILSPLEMLLSRMKEDPDNVHRSTLELIHLNACRLSMMIEEILDLTSLSIGKTNLQLVEIKNPFEYFKKLFDSITPLMQKNSVEGKFECEEELPTLCFDKLKMDKIIFNLLSNAIKFTPAGGQVMLRIECTKPPSSPSPLVGDAWGEGKNFVLKLSVADSGVGIPEEKLAAIFERFIQVDTSSTRIHGGMGIGLSLVKDFVELQGGSIEVKSQIDQGSTFTVSIPMNSKPRKALLTEENESDSPAALPRMLEAIQKITKPSPATPKNKSRETFPCLLLIEDHVDLRNFLSEILKESYVLLFASDGEEGLRLAHQEKPDLILSDIMMPKKDGYQLIQELKANPHTQEIPVIFLTAKSSKENLAQALKLGAADILTKPFSPQDILSRIQNVLGKYNVLVIDDDPFIALTWKSLKQHLKIRRLACFQTIEAFQESKLNPQHFDFSFVDLKFKCSTNYQGAAAVEYLKQQKIPHVLIASGSSGKKIPDSLDKLIQSDDHKIPQNN